MKKSLVIGFIILGATGCNGGSSSSSASPSSSSAGSVQTSLLNSAASSNHQQPSSSELENPTCKSSISLEEPGLEPLISPSDMPKKKFVLSEMDMYHRSSNNNSFSASAKSTNGFSVSLDCDGVSTLNADGSSADTDDLSAHFQTSVFIDGLTHQMADQQRLIQLSFHNGSLISSKSDLVPEDNSASQVASDAKFPLDRIQVAADTYATIRIYALPSGNIEFIAMFDFPGDAGSKNRTIEFGKAIYQPE